MSFPLRAFGIAAFASLLGACAHQAAVAPPRERVVAPITNTAPESQNAPPAPATTTATPTLTMPAEWQHHNGEDYDDLFDRMRAGFAFDEVSEPAIDQQVSWYEHNPEYMERVFQRSQRYMYHIITEVEARGMPTEFALLPVVESAYEPFAYSVSNAAGLWQFIPGTGVRFGLKRTWWYDGRRDVIESTRAALDYLQSLHDEFGDWLLAIASYNVGEAYVERAIAFNKSVGKPADFWHINLPAETRAYVPKLLAMKRLMAEPERYGLEFAPMPNQPYFAVIDTDSQIDLKIVAQLAGTSYDEIVALNPGYNRWATDPVGPQRMLVPIDNADAYQTALKTLAPEDRVRYTEHEVAKRETLPMIAKRYGTSVAVLVQDQRPEGRPRERRPDLEDSGDQRQGGGQGIARRLASRPARGRERRAQGASDRLPRAWRRDVVQHRPPQQHAGRHVGASQQPRLGRFVGEGPEAGHQGQQPPASATRAW